MSSIPPSEIAATHHTDLGLAALEAIRVEALGRELQRLVLPVGIGITAIMLDGEVVGPRGCANLEDELLMLFDRLLRHLTFLDGLAIHEIVSEMKRAAIYARVSTDSQTVENQLQALQDIAARSGWTVVQVFTDEGISGAKGRGQRPGLDALLKAVARREVDLVAAWSVDRLGRSLSDLIGFLSDIQASGCDLFLHQQALDTSTNSGRLLFGMLSLFADFERSMIVSRVKAGVDRARAKGVRFGRPPTPVYRLERVKKALKDGQSIRAAAKATGVSTATVQKVKRSMKGDEGCRETANL